MASRETTRQVFERWLAAWSSHDASKLAALVTDDCTWEDVTNGVHHGKQAVEALAQATYEMVPDLDLEILNVFIGERWFIAEWQASGTNACDFPGAQASGTRFRTRGASVLALREGKIHRYSSYWDTNGTKMPFAESEMPFFESEMPFAESE
ncbi:nuclear transport factor 2 family protein [Sorangium sp. So ce1000]|uniref:nuclear transport factor 2 family protein n=1 Tax=Sorangium sp. So ce1000 TaxID=3133325 RepID=UPI003F646B37